jgi:hypothetical protein
MSANEDLPHPPAALDSAAVLRRRVEELERARLDRAAAERRRHEEDRRERVRAFLEQRLTDADLARINRRIHAAVEAGRLEVEVMRFPAGALSDHGRAVNNHDPEWPKTLRGPAAEWFALFQRRAQPNGFKMRAAIVSFPDGKPGEVGLFLSWA